MAEMQFLCCLWWAWRKHMRWLSKRQSTLNHHQARLLSWWSLWSHKKRLRWNRKTVHLTCWELITEDWWTWLIWLMCNCSDVCRWDRLRCECWRLLSNFIKKPRCDCCWFKRWSQAWMINRTGKNREIWWAYLSNPKHNKGYATWWHNEESDNHGSALSVSWMTFCKLNFRWCRSKASEVWRKPKRRNCRAWNPNDQNRSVMRLHHSSLRWNFWKTKQHWMREYSMGSYSCKRLKINTWTNFLKCVADAENSCIKTNSRQYHCCYDRTREFAMT